jgi:aspartate/methionine/tyrosine aminotransferase
MMTIAPARPGVANLQPSLIRKLANSAMGREDLLPLWFGEPDLPTPQFIRDVAKDAIDEGQTFYQPNAGIPALRKALTSYNNHLYGSTLEMDNIIVTGSGLAALAVACQLVIAQGDEIVMPSPVWPNLPSIPAILDANVVRVSLRPQDGYWGLDLDELFDSVTDKTRALLINSPNNPTGWMLSDEEQQTILDFCRERDLWLIADEVYSRIVYDRPFAPSFANKVTDDDKFLIVNSFSKAWAMTGWRLGWLIAPKSLLSTLEMLVEFNFSCVFAPIQIAGIVALQEGEGFIAESLRRYKAGLDLVTEQLDSLPRVTFPRPRAAFYAFFAVDGVSDSYNFALDLLNKTGVGLAPGAAFGPEGEGYLRLCYAAETNLLQHAFDKMRPLLS